MGSIGSTTGIEAESTTLLLFSIALHNLHITATIITLSTELHLSYSFRSSNSYLYIMKSSIIFDLSVILAIGNIS
jgi:hypothetical protein